MACTYFEFSFQSQDFDSTLILYNEEKLPYIQADDRQDGKWDITFSIETGAIVGNIFPNDFDDITYLYQTATYVDIYIIATVIQYSQH